MLVFIFVWPSCIFAQQGGRATIMVVPWTSTSEDIREKLESDFTYRAILNEIRRAFDERGFTTIDFVEALRNSNTNRATGMENWRDNFKNIIDNSTADIFVEAEIQYLSEKYGNKVNILLDAKDKYTSQSLINSGLLSSDQTRTEDYALLAKKALERDGAVNNFLDGLNIKFGIIREQGRTIALRIEVLQNSSVDLDTEMGENGDYLSDIIIDWVKSTSAGWNQKGLIRNGGYHIKGQTASLLWFDQINIPFTNETGERYEVNQFSREIRKAIAGMGLNSDKGGRFEVQQNIRGNEVTITLKN